MPLHRRVPKRGFHNVFRTEFAVVNLDTLAERFDAGTVITPDLLRERGLVRGRHHRIKVLGARRHRQEADGAGPQVQRKGGGEDRCGGRRRAGDWYIVCLVISDW